MVDCTGHAAIFLRFLNIDQIFFIFMHVFSFDSLALPRLIIRESSFHLLVVFRGHKMASSNTHTEIKVWDPLVRVFHWTLVGAFFIAFLTEDDLMGVHSLAGYTVVALVLLRIIWGFVGSKHARFKDFVSNPGIAWSYAKDALALRAKRYVGHNPAGGFMIVVMLIVLLATGFSGMVLYAVTDGAGPFASWFSGADYAWLKGPLEEVHEFFANGMMLLVLIHLAGVLWESRVHGENLVRAMWTGRKYLNIGQRH